MEQATAQKMTLGARIRAQMEEERLHPLEAARKAAHRAPGDTGKKFDLVEAMFERAKASFEQDVSSGIFPKPVRLTSEEECALSTYGWHTRQDKRLQKHESAFQLQVAFDEWAKAEEIAWAFIQGHDGGGMKSWWDIKVLTPAQVEKLKENTKLKR